MFFAFCACFVAIAVGYVGRARIQSTSASDAIRDADPAARAVVPGTPPRVPDHSPAGETGGALAIPPPASAAAESGRPAATGPAAVPTPASVAAVPDGSVVKSLSVLGSQPGLLFASAAFDQTNGYLAIASLHSPETDRYRTELRCERVHFAAGVGICLAAQRGFFTTFSAHTFGPDFRIRHTVPLPGLPSRARVSPDGRRAAMTIFVSGDSYSSVAFSTRTTVLDVATGKVIADLESFDVSRAGARFKAIDFNFWGVTFARDGNRFYATLSSGGTNYLVEGDVDARTARVLREGVECPSLSPDNTRLVFKSRLGPSSWRLHLLDLATLKDTPLAEAHSVDDQAEWLDDESVAYMLPSPAGGSDVWTLSVTSQAPPRVLARKAYSPTVIH